MTSQPPSIYPDDLFQSGIASDPGRQWLVLYTKSRQEQALARQLLQMQIPFYLPLVPRVTSSGSRPYRYQQSLFGNYLFLFADDEERVRCLMTNRVSRVIPVIDHKALQADLASLERLIKAGMSVSMGARLKPERKKRVWGYRDGNEAAGKAEPGVYVALDLDRGGLWFDFTGEELGEGEFSQQEGIEHVKKQRITATT